MALKLMYITNSPAIAKICDKAGVDRVFIDLEIVGKAQRQGFMDTVISSHEIEDIDRVKSVLATSEVLVRVNPIYQGSAEEIERVAQSNADIVMLPYFSSVEEVKTFFSLLNGRKKACLLFETPASVATADEILALGRIDEAFIGLNDLHLGYGRKFMFELLSDGTVEKLCAKFKKLGIPYGFGGVARPEHGLLKGKYIIGEHCRLGSTAVILSRSFCNLNKVSSIEEVEDIMLNGVKEIREWEKYFENATEKALHENKAILTENVEKIIAVMAQGE